MLHAVSYSDFSHWFNFSRRGQSRFGLLSALNLAFSPRRNRPATRSFIRLIVRPIPSRLFPKTRRTSKPAPRRRGWGEGGRHLKSPSPHGTTISAGSPGGASPASLQADTVAARVKQEPFPSATKKIEKAEKSISGSPVVFCIAGEP